MTLQSIKFTPTHGRYIIIDPCYVSFTTVCEAATCFDLLKAELPLQKYTREEVFEKIRKDLDTVQLTENGAGDQMVVWSTLEGGGGYDIDIIPHLNYASSKEISVDGGMISLMPLANDYVPELNIQRIGHIIYPKPGTEIEVSWMPTDNKELNVQIHYHEVLIDNKVSIRIIG